MTMSNNDSFFDMFKESLEGYSPEVSESVYAGLRSKMRWNNFWRFSLTSLNAWTLITLIGIGGGIWYGGRNKSLPLGANAQKTSTSIHLKNDDLPLRAATLSKLNSVTESKSKKLSSADNAITQPKMSSNFNREAKSKTRIKGKDVNSKKKYTKRNNNHDGTNRSNGLTNSFETSKYTKEIVSTPPSPLSSTKEYAVNGDQKKNNPPISNSSVNVKGENSSKQFTGTIPLQDIQPETKGLNKELKQKNKKEFKIKLKVPKE